MEKIPFFKMSGSGNDFIIIDHRTPFIDESRLRDWLVSVCRRKMSVGADGLILIENARETDFKWQFFNSDGSRAEMCGNGARCAARFAYLNKMAGTQMTFETDAGLIAAEIIGERVKVKMTEPQELYTELPLALNGGDRMINAINTGVPHVVIETADLDTLDVIQLGREIRYHADFAPAGTNVNFIADHPDGGIAIRTYERGVEDETLACGTGSVAGALVAAGKYRRPSPIDVMTRSGIRLSVHFEWIEDRFTHVFLEGDARVVYEGEMWPEAWDLWIKQPE
jgi:diaminopimelate epimerase